MAKNTVVEKPKSPVRKITDKERVEASRACLKRISECKFSSEACKNTIKGNNATIEEQTRLLYRFIDVKGMPLFDADDSEPHKQDQTAKA